MDAACSCWLAVERAEVPSGRPLPGNIVGKVWRDELAAFLTFTAQDRELVLYHVAAATGMRRGELLGLRWRDVDLKAAKLSVKQQYTRQGNGLGSGPPKSRKSIRTIDVDQETIALLREQQEHQRFDRRAWN